MWETKIKDIYSSLQDERSRRLFQTRLMYSLTGDERFIYEMIEALPQKHRVDTMMEKAGQVKDKLIIYGAGNDLTLLSKLYPALSCVCLCDRDPVKQKSGWKGFHVISPEQLTKDYQGYHVLISTTGFQREIYDFLIKSGWEQGKILNVGAVTDELYQQQYFDKEIMRPCQDETMTAVRTGCLTSGAAEVTKKFMPLSRMQRIMKGVWELQGRLQIWN